MRIEELTDEHVGRRVIYTANHGEREVGTISSWNENMVFVRYGLGPTAAATNPERLEFET